MNNKMRLKYDELEMMALGFDSYENEFETMKLFMKDPMAEISAQSIWDLCCGEKNNTTNDSSNESIYLREQGNKLFKVSPERNALEASHLYTKSILAAPPGSEALALAHANRAIALQKFGYFQQAYDDCECALEQGYPINLRHKIIARQATCAEKLGDATLLEKHLKSLMALSLNKTYEAQVEELQQSLEKLKLKEINSKKYEQNDKEYRGAHRIAKTASKGRFLVAESPIKKDQLIFTERAFSFVPASRRHVCQHCAATQLIPFPCYNCNGRVVYCSLKCRVAHQTTHGYECLAYQKDLFVMKREYLALRMVLDGIRQVIPFLCQKLTSEDIWSELTSEKSNLRQSNHQYIQSLCMITHLEKKSLPDILNMANAAFLMTHYLRKQTNFFNLFKDTKASLKDWQLVIASFILRHMGQLNVNANTITVLTIKITDPFESTLLVNKLWQSPFHVRRGYLHMLSNHEEVINANFPYYSLCNNACFPSIVTKRNGRFLSAYAVNNIEAGAEILNSYTRGYKNVRRTHRQSFLKEKYHFECKCVKCTKENPDEDYEKFHRFRCETCNAIFFIETDIILRCTKCRTAQHKLCDILNFLEEPIRRTSYEMKMNDNPFLKSILNEKVKAYEDLDRWLVDPHDIKFKMSIKLVENCFEMADDIACQSNVYNFKGIIEILKFYLRCTIERYHLKSINYVGAMTYLWDFIALGKYQYTAEEMQEMLQAIEILPDETRKLFINYYNDYIVSNIK